MRNIRQITFVCSAAPQSEYPFGLVALVACPRHPSRYPQQLLRRPFPGLLHVAFARPVFRLPCRAFVTGLFCYRCLPSRSVGLPALRDGGSAPRQFRPVARKDAKRCCDGLGEDRSAVQGRLIQSFGRCDEDWERLRWTPRWVRKWCWARVRQSRGRWMGGWLLCVTDLDGLLL